MSDKDIKRFKEVFDECLSKSFNELKKELGEEKKETLIKKFKKIIGE